MNQSKRHLVVTFGIPDFERQILDRIFRLSSSRPLTYGLADDGQAAQGADIALLDPSSQKALAEWRSALSDGHSLRTVHVVKEVRGDSTPTLCRPFLAKRVLTVLDEVLTEDDERPADTAGTRTAPNAHAAPQAGGTAKGAGGVSYHALVVDDSEMIRAQVGLALQDVNVGVAYAESGEKALEMVGNQAFDIIFLDVLMTGLDGYEVCKAIKRDKARRHIPVVMLTSQSSPFDKIRGKFSGCDSYLTKPVGREEFHRTLDKYLIHALASD